MQDIRYAQKLAYLQIIQISKTGCGQFKCKDCVMNEMCDHFPDHSKLIANKLILMSKEVN